ncbi:MAG: histidine phosphatase family protein [Nanoarchaeota archaeon]|nr:histidine phosphatase family protein [Nanoarchaeota archaeon]
MGVKITYFVHGTTPDNLNSIASGWSNVGLSELGIKQSEELRRLIKDKKFDAVFSSDLKRAVQTAEIVFGKVIKDKRLREINFGDLTGSDFKEIEKRMEEFIEKPFPNGECYKDVERRIRDFLNEALEKYDGKHIAIVAHQAPQLALEVITKGKLGNRQ